jgi:copper chaperone
MTLDSKINCGGCIAKVQSDLNALLGEGNWSVDTTLPNKPLTFSDDIDADDVLDVLEAHNMIAE